MRAEFEQRVTEGRSFRILISAAGFLIGSGCGALELFYRWKAVPGGAEWLYPWIEPLCFAFLFGGFGLAWLVWLKAGWKIRLSLAAGIFVLTFWIGFAVSGAKDLSVQVEHSPEGDYKLAIRTEKEEGSFSVGRISHGILYRERWQLEEKGKGEIKVQWLEEDICAVTCENGEGKVCQYVETFGDRGDGISYLDPLAAVNGVWKDSSGTTVTVESGRVTVTAKGETETYEESDCLRSGTIALTLCRNGIPKWNLVMNQDCRINYDDRIAAGGTLTFCPVSVKKTEPLILEAKDEREAYKETAPQAEEDPKESREEMERTDIEILRAAASGGKTLEEAKSEAGRPIYESRSRDEDVYWNIRNILKEAQEAYRINGVDCRTQICSIQRLKGDEADGLYQVETSERYVSPGNQGAGPTGETVQMTYKIRMMQRTEGGYCALLFHANGDGGYGLSGEAGEKKDFSEDLQYHFFQEGDYDTTYMYTSRRSPVQGMMELYEQQLKTRYPEAVQREFDGRMSLDLTGEGREFLIYDGISEELTDYCFCRIRVSEGDTDGRMTVEESYRIGIIPG